VTAVRPLVSEFGVVAFTGQCYLHARKPELEQVAANLIDLAWNGLSQLDARQAIPFWLLSGLPG